MAGVNVTINGRVYRLACDEGQEAHLMGLASEINRHVDGLKGSFGEIGDARLTVMAALTIADELHEARRKTRALEADIIALQTHQQALTDRLAGKESTLTQALISTAERMERLAETMAPTLS